MPRSSRRSRHALFPSIVRRVDERVGRRIYRAATPSAVNTSLFTLSAVAENGLFWTGVVSLVALTGSRGRHAALRGALTLGASSLLANLGAKQLVRAPRPRLRGLTHRHLNHTPTSPSFPSGHTATGAGLAAGIWIVSPRRGILAAALALAVGYSRLHVGAHWLSDVLVGNLVGVTVGLVGRLVFRPAPRHEAPIGSPHGELGQ
jgi:membrane-associated phospholipid phosphatase